MSETIQSMITEITRRYDNPDILCRYEYDSLVLVSTLQGKFIPSCDPGVGFVILYDSSEEKTDYTFSDALYKIFSTPGATLADAESLTGRELYSQCEWTMNDLDWTSWGSPYRLIIVRKIKAG